MKNFGDYAYYYDLLYQDKNYADEVEFIHQLIQSHLSEAQTILDLGCGTGRHSILLAQKGYDVHGIDQSLVMLTQARERKNQNPIDSITKIAFSQADIRHFQLDQKFDVILLLFHVLNYQIETQDVLNTLQSAQQHLKPGGVILFDSWYGPAVLMEPPTVRIKRFENESLQITRISEPTLMTQENRVDVHYQLFIRDKINDKIREVKELHKMRYFFHPELDFLLSQLNLKIFGCGEWLSAQSINQKSWSVYFLAQELS